MSKPNNQSICSIPFGFPWPNSVLNLPNASHLSVDMEVPDSYAIGYRPRRYCLPAVIRANSVECRPRPLGMIRRSVSSNVTTPVTVISPYGGKYTPNWSYFYNRQPNFRDDKTYFGDPRNVYWSGKYSNFPAVNTWEKKATNSTNCRDFLVQKHWKYPFSYWARYYWNERPVLHGVKMRAQ